MNAPAPLRKFRPRAFTSLVVALGFVVLLISGGVLFLAPPGRVANWTNWQIFGLTKHGWGDLHITFAALFLVAGVAHMVFNFRPLLQHLGARLAGRSGFRMEWVVALVLGLAVFAGTRARVAPLGSLLAWSEQLREGWEKPAERAPLPHAELLSLRELAEQAGLTPEVAISRLEESGLGRFDPETQVTTIAEEAKLAPAQLYEVLQGRPARASTSAAGPHETGTGRGIGGGGGGGGGERGGGPGRKTLAQFCQEEGIDLAAASARLTARGMKASPEQTLRDIATQNGFDRPYALLEVLRQK